MYICVGVSVVASKIASLKGRIPVLYYSRYITGQNKNQAIIWSNPHPRIFGPYCLLFMTSNLDPLILVFLNTLQENRKSKKRNSNVRVQDSFKINLNAIAVIN